MNTTTTTTCTVAAYLEKMDATAAAIESWIPRAAATKDSDLADALRAAHGRYLSARNVISQLDAALAALTAQNVALQQRLQAAEQAAKPSDRAVLRTIKKSPNGRVLEIVESEQLLPPAEPEYDIVPQRDAKTGLATTFRRVRRPAK